MYVCSGVKLYAVSEKDPSTPANLHSGRHINYFEVKTRFTTPKTGCRMNSTNPPINETVDIEPDQPSDETPASFAELLGELRSIHEVKGKTGTLFIFIITLILFFTTKIVSTDWREIVILVGVLFFHELGHLLAMKLLGYRDVKMFFIPFLGAAVSGKSDSGSAIKNCIVSLMGPLPGIVAGIVLTILFGFVHNFYILKAAQMLLILNAFNLLPFMPLDGGRFVDVLFVNRRVFRLLFAIFGSGVFIILAFLSQDLLIGVVGVLGIIGAVSSFKTRAIAEELKREGFTTDGLSQLLQDETAAASVIVKIEKSYPSLFKPRIVPRSIYDHFTNIVDTLRFVPSGIVSKLFLFPAYGLMLLLSIGAAALFMAMDYREEMRVVRVNDEAVVMSDHFAFGRKVSEVPVSSSGFLHGDGKRYNGDTTRVTGTFHYENGFRTGEWLYYDSLGNVEERAFYENGSLVRKETQVDGEWKKFTLKELPLMRRVIESIKRSSQPNRSLHEYFEE